jgi:DNA-binding NarL/FixJ family response regulator
MKSIDTTRRIFLIDDHPVVRDGLRAVLDIPGRYRVCGEAATPAQALRHLSRAHVDCAIIDLMFKRSKRIDAISELRGAFPDLPIVVLSMLDRATHERDARDAGASAYIEKNEAPRKLLAALDCIFSENSRPSPKKLPGLALLTPRERTIFEALGKGLDKHHIAAELGNHVKTIETHREAIKHKLGVGSCRELVRLAVHTSSGG